MRTSSEDPEEDDPGRRCCDASEFNGAADGRSSHNGNLADLAEEAAEVLPLLLVRGCLIRVLVKAPSPAELLNPTESQPCR